jgi:hypothetical protein
VSFLIFVGMEKWMDSKKEIEIGDYVIYKDSREVVCDTDTNYPVKVITITVKGRELIVVYENGGYDFIKHLEKASPLLLELL